MMPFQKEDNAAEVVHRTYELNDFKVEGERRKVDLPAQKNLLTNYFCTASLEAKQKLGPQELALFSQIQRLEFQALGLTVEREPILINLRTCHVLAWSSWCIFCSGG